MIREFEIVWEHRGLLLDGFLTTLWLTVLAGTGSLLLGALLSAGLMSRHPAVAAAGRLLVDTMRCVPFLLFAYIIYYGLPSVGLSLGNWTAGLLALVLYHLAYTAELLRGAWAELSPEQVEAGRAFGFKGLGLLRRIILPPVAAAALPTLGNQVVQIIKDSAFLTIIAVQELTHAATAIQATFFVPFAAFLAALLLYWALCLGVEGIVSLAGRRVEAWR